MLALELICGVIVAFFVVTRARLDDDPWGFVRRLALLAAASWIGENSVIHAYHFYQYSPQWSLFVDRVPLMILLIWPVVIHSAWDLIRRLAGRGSLGAAVAAGALVLTDASLIEPVAVAAGLWSWNAPGLFEVPPIGVLGWSYFAALCLVILDQVERRRARWPWELSLLAAPAAGTHVLLLVTWYGALRWVSVTIAPWPVVGLLWLISLLLTIAAIHSPRSRHVPRLELLLRVPAALFFFVLLGLHGRDQPALVAYTLGFAPPYLALTVLARGGGKPSPREWSESAR